MTTAEPLQASSSTHPDRSVDHTVPTAARRGLHVRCGVDDGNDVQLGHADRPTWRGRIHVIGLVVAIPAVSALVLFSNVGTGLRIALAVYAVGLCTMLGASATYHRWVHGLRARCVWRRIDHAAIFAAIAGSSTPILLASLPGATGVALIGAVWSAALLGAGFKLSRWAGGDRAGMVMYAVTIVVSAAAVPWLWVRHGVGPASLVVVGGVVYLVGAAGFAKRWPTLRPSVFSFHEVWHVFTVVAATTQFGAIWMLAA
jgi:hemolysin III